MATKKTNTEQTIRAVTGVEIAQGLGVRPARGFWADAWGQVLARPVAVIAIVWIGIIAFLAIFAPLLANGHPLILRTLDESGTVISTSSPLLEHLSSADILLLIAGVLGPIWLLVPIKKLPRSDRAVMLMIGGLQAGVISVVGGIIASIVTKRDAADWVRDLEQGRLFVPLAAAAIGGVISAAFLAVPTTKRFVVRLAFVLLVGLIASWAVSVTWNPKLSNFDYRQREAAGEVRAVFTLVPFSPTQSSSSLYLKPPGTTMRQALPEDEALASAGDPTFVLGTDGVGQDVLSQMLHASRLSISVGFVSTSIAVVIGVTIGALMGYFGGWVDLVLFRVVEIFMAIPVLFLLIVAAAVLPRNTYVMMAIIGCVTWTGAARFVRAEFLKLRNQDFVQAAKSAGLPLRSILFKHMLPNGVTPVLVDASFAIALAILIEAILSFLGLGPDGQPSWGKLLANATSDVGTFVWWLAIFPGLAIFLTVLAYNLIGEALRDAIDPKLKKARV